MHASFEIMAISPTPVLILLVGSDTSRQRSHVVALLSALAGCILQLLRVRCCPEAIGSMMQSIVARQQTLNVEHLLQERTKDLPILAHTLV